MKTSFYTSQKTDYLDVIFLNKNKAYGAYFLRRIYPSHLKRSIFYGVFVFVLLMSLPLIIGAFSNEKIETEKIDRVYKLTPYKAQKTIDKKLVENKVKTNKQTTSKTSSRRFLPPVIVKDKDASEAPPKIDDISVNTGFEDIKSELTTYLPPEPPKVMEEIIESDDKVYDIVEQLPSFPGGELAFREYMKGFKVPEIARRNLIDGKVFISFVVDKTGIIRDVKVKLGLDEAIDREAIKMVKNMPPWKPGKQNGKEVNVMFTLPIKITVR